jgi:hypothetical protein
MKPRQLYGIVGVVLLLIGFIVSGRREGLDAKSVSGATVSGATVSGGKASWWSMYGPSIGGLPWDATKSYKAGDTMSLNSTPFVAKIDNMNVGIGDPQFSATWDAVKTTTIVNPTQDTLAAFRSVIGTTTSVGMTVLIVCLMIFGGVIGVTYAYKLFFGGGSTPSYPTMVR